MWSRPIQVQLGPDWSTSFLSSYPALLTSLHYPMTRQLDIQFFLKKRMVFFVIPGTCLMKPLFHWDILAHLAPYCSYIHFFHPLIQLFNVQLLRAVISQVTTRTEARASWARILYIFLCMTWIPRDSLCRSMIIMWAPVKECSGGDTCWGDVVYWWALFHLAVAALQTFLWTMVGIYKT